MRKLFFLILLALVGCSQYRAVTYPLRHIPANCHCRYAEAAKHLYRCELAENLHNGLPPKVAQLEALRVANEWVAKVQMKEARQPRLRCDCNDPRKNRL